VQAWFTDGKLELIPVGSKNRLWSFERKKTVWGVSWSPDSKRIVASTSDEGVYVFDASNGKIIYTYSGLIGRVFSPAWSPNGKFIAAIGTKTGAEPAPDPVTLAVWDADSQKTIFELMEHAATRVAWAPDSKRIAFNNYDHTVQIWDVLEKRKLAAIPVAERGLPSVAWSPDGKYLAVGDVMGETTIYDSTSAEAITNHVFGANFVNLNWSPDGKTINAIGFEESTAWPLEFEQAKIKRTEIKAKVLGDKGYMPKNLDECFVQLDAELGPAQIKKLKDGSEEDLALYHLGLGMWMRNSWGLWSNSQLARSFLGLDIHHSDDMSGIILTSYWRHLHGLPLELDKQAKRYIDYWAQFKKGYPTGH